MTFLSRPTHAVFFRRPLRFSFCRHERRFALYQRERERKVLQSENNLLSIPPSRSSHSTCSLLFRSSTTGSMLAHLHSVDFAAFTSYDVYLVVLGEVRVVASGFRGCSSYVYVQLRDHYRGSYTHPVSHATRATRSFCAELPSLRAPLTAGGMVVYLFI